MSRERMQVLEMLASGKITPEEAERLLEKLGAASATGNSSPFEEKAPTRAPKYFCVHVDSAKGDNVDLRLPFLLIRTGIKLSAMMPKGVSETLAKNGLDVANLGSLSDEELIQVLRDTTVDVTSSKGDKIRVYCE